MWRDMYLASDGWGFLEMHIYKDTVGVAITDKIMLDGLPDEMKNLVGKDLISWSEDEIKRVEIPFGEYGKFLYSNGNIVLDAKIPSTNYDWETEEYTEVFTIVKVRGSLQGNILTMLGSVVGDEFGVNFTLDKK